MRFIFTAWSLATAVVNNMFNRRWWYLWFFQVVFIAMLIERISLEPKNEFLYALFMGWSTMIVTMLNIEASYADAVKKMLARASHLFMAKSSIDETNAD